MALTQGQFLEKWKTLGEGQSDVLKYVAWKRYQDLQDESLQATALHVKDTQLQQLKETFLPLLEDSHVSSMIENYEFLSLSANTIPWYATGIHVKEEQPISVIAVGKTWRSKLLDLYLPPQFNLWYRIGVNGAVFNSTRNTRTFKCIAGSEGELYLAHQSPGMFSDRFGGRMTGTLDRESAEGAFHILIIQWAPNMSIHGDVKNALEKMTQIDRKLAIASNTEPDSLDLLKTANARLASDYFANKFPMGWTLLWFLGVSEIYTQEQDEAELTLQNFASKNDYLTVQVVDTGLAADPESAVLSPISSRPSAVPPSTMIRCLPNHNVGILQKDVNPPFGLTRDTVTTWSWNITALPSRIREDSSLSHDYLSLAFEFENGRDITYTWSWELPVNYGYWCPLANWTDREYHVVIRSGTEQLGQWLDEKRNLWRDYIEYINGGDKAKAVPKQITKVWLIAGNRWQRYKGEMLIKKIVLKGWDGDDNGLVVL